MMSGQGVNPNFFHEKKKKKTIGRPEHSLTFCPLRPITSHFPLIPPQSGRHMCITPNENKYNENRIEK